MTSLRERKGAGRAGSSARRGSGFAVESVGRGAAASCHCRWLDGGPGSRPCPSASRKPEGDAQAARKDEPRARALIETTARPRVEIAARRRVLFAPFLDDSRLRCPRRRNENRAGFGQIPGRPAQKGIRRRRAPSETLDAVESDLSALEKRMDRRDIEYRTQSDIGLDIIDVAKSA